MLVAPRDRPVRDDTDGTYSSWSYVPSIYILTLLSPIIGTRAVTIRLVMAVVPILRLLALFCLSVFMGLPVVVREGLPLGAVFVVIPVVIVLMA